MASPPRRVVVVRVDTLKHPRLYSARQVNEARAIAYALNRGKFVLCRPPEDRGAGHRG